MKPQELDLKIKHRIDEHQARFDKIAKRGMDAGLKTASKDLQKEMIHVAAGIMAYMKTAVITDQLHQIGGPDHVPQEIEDQIDKALNKMDDQMTLEISAMV